MLNNPINTCNHEKPVGRSTGRCKRGRHPRSRWRDEERERPPVYAAVRRRSSKIRTESLAKEDGLIRADRDEKRNRLEDGKRKN